MTHIPTITTLAILALGTFRLVRIFGWDEITVDIRRWATGISDTDYNQVAKFVESVKASGGNPWDIDDSGGVNIPLSERRYYLAKLVRCAWCIGWWISVAVWLLWSWEPRVTLWVAVPFAISALVGLVAKNLDP